MSYDVVLTRSANASQYGQNLPEIHEPQNVEFMPSTVPHVVDTGSLSPTKRTQIIDNNATPSRNKNSSRFMSAFAQFYGNDDDSDQMIASTSSSISTTKNIGNVDDSYPEIKGRVESKLMSMWHNVKYGKQNFCFYFYLLYTRTFEF